VRFGSKKPSSQIHGSLAGLLKSGGCLGCCCVKCCGRGNGGRGAEIGVGTVRFVLDTINGAGRAGKRIEGSRKAGDLPLVRGTRRLLLVERSTRTENVYVFICVQYITMRNLHSMGLCLRGWLSIDGLTFDALH
jgi:hypothetical protein